MNGSIRVSAKTVDDAITEALIQLGVTSDRLEYEVIEKGSAGFLGIGIEHFGKSLRPETAQAVAGINIMIAGVDVAVVLEREPGAAGLGKDA